MSALTNLAEALRLKRLKEQEESSPADANVESGTQLSSATSEISSILPAEVSSIIPLKKEAGVNLAAPTWKDQFPSNQGGLSALARLKMKLAAPIVVESPAQESSAQAADATDIGIEDIANLPLSINPNATTDKYGNLITYNSKQAEFIRIAGEEGNSAVLIGAAGTGKTTCQKGVVQALIQSGRAGRMVANGHKHLQADTPGIVICAFTRRAVANIRKNVSLDMQNNCITIHKLLEYQPVYYTVLDDITGEEKNKMQFEATRNSSNPLPSSIRTIIFEESSMLGTDLYKEVIDACPHNPQLIFLGDIQQLPPVFGPAILGFKLLELPVVELTEVYRQALESPIISLAHRILSGKGIESSEFEAWKFPNQMTIRPWKKKISADDALYTAGQFFIHAHTHGIYSPTEDTILIPFNKSFGTDELNKLIANHLAHERKEFVYEIIAGFQKVYLSPGDKCLYDKEDSTIVQIERNPGYSGAEPTNHSLTLDYWGHDPEYSALSSSEGTDVDFLLSQVASGSGEDRVNQASHIVTIKMNDTDTEVRLQSAGDINSLLLGYALTVHKAQGSEWEKVFIVMHQSHATMNSRELLYTAVTRAKKECYIICEPDTFVKGIASQRVKGDTLEEKAMYFRGKVDSGFNLKD